MSEDSNRRGGAGRPDGIGEAVDAGRVTVDLREELSAEELAAFAAAAAGAGRTLEEHFLFITLGTAARQPG